MFANKRVVYPGKVPGGELVGNLYWVCWDEEVVQHLMSDKTLAVAVFQSEPVVGKALATVILC